MTGSSRGGSDLLRRCVGERVGPSDDEGVEGEARIERRSAESHVAGIATGSGRPLPLLALNRPLSPAPASSSALRLGEAEREYRRPDDQIEAAHAALRPSSRPARDRYSAIESSSSGNGSEPTAARSRCRRLELHPGKPA